MFLMIKSCHVCILICLFINVSVFSQTPSGYCDVSFNYDVEPITYFEFGGIRNMSSTEINFGSALEDFTYLVSAIEPGRDYDIILEGNTGGNYTNYYTVYIDFSQDSVFDESETFHIGTITNSNGADSIQLQSSIFIPSLIEPGYVRMRVVKNYDDPIEDACATGSYGQAEDYTLLILDNSPMYYYRNSYCKFNVTIDIEPITYFEFAGIQNRTSAAVDSSPGTEIFTQYYSIVVPGDSVEVILEGNTAGNYTNHYTMFVDWDRNGLYGDQYSNEYYVIGSITNSNGEDSIQLRKVIHVPENAIPGSTLLTIVKNYSDIFYNTANFTNNPAYTAFYSLPYGQAEEYTLIVAEPEPEPLPEITFDSIALITFVSFAGIHNEMPAEIDSMTQALANYEHVVGMASPGDTVMIQLKGNTGGNNTFYFTAYFDWNQNGRLDDTGEEIQLGVISNSSGTDSVQLELPVVMPDSIPTGPVRLRVVMNTDAFVSGAHSINVTGQAADFTVYFRKRISCGS